MESGSHLYALGVLEKALRRIATQPSLHEGLYHAYLEDLQWLEDVADLPEELEQLLRDVRGSAELGPVESRAVVAGRSISRMPRARIGALIEQLEAQRVRILTAQTTLI
jgi:hypothetical protein